MVMYIPEIKRSILYEVLISTATGILLSIILTQTVGVFVLGIHVTIGQNLLLTAILTGSGIIKGYLIRSYFETRRHRHGEFKRSKARNTR